MSQNYCLLHPSALLFEKTEDISRKLAALGRNGIQAIYVDSPVNHPDNPLLAERLPQLLKSLHLLPARVTESIYVCQDFSFCLCADKLIAQLQGSADVSLIFYAFPRPLLRSFYKEYPASRTHMYYLDGKTADQPVPLTEDFLFLRQEPSSGQSVRFLDTVDHLPVNVQTLPELNYLPDASSRVTSLYSFGSEGHKKILKSVSPAIVADDYPDRLRRLNAIEPLFYGAGIPSALPRELLTAGSQVGGFVMNAFLGPSLASLMKDSRFQSYAAGTRLPADMAGRIWILMKLLHSVCLLHTAGITLSDIRATSFLITTGEQVIPVGSDGFSVEGYTSAPAPNAGSDANTLYYLQNGRQEARDLADLIFRFLMADNDPERLLPALMHPQTGEQSSPRASALLSRWMQLPEQLRDTLAEVLTNQAFCPADLLLRRLTTAYCLLTGQTSTSIYGHASAGGSFIPLRDAADTTIGLFKELRLLPALSSSGGSKPAKPLKDPVLPGVPTRKPSVAAKATASDSRPKHGLRDTVFGLILGGVAAMAFYLFCHLTSMPLPFPIP